MAAVLPKGVFSMKKMLSMLFLSLVIIGSSMSSFAVVAGANIGTEAIQSGMVSLRINQIYESKLLFLVEKDGNRYTYPVDDDGNLNYFPLQMGSGDYLVRLMENVEGNRYKEVIRKAINLNALSENEIFLQSVIEINWTEDSPAVLKAKSLTKGMTLNSDKIKVIYDYITSNYTYDFDKIPTLNSSYIPNINQVYYDEKGICYDYSALLASMLRSVGVPTKMVKGYSDLIPEQYHAWNEVYVNGSWKIVDTTYDAAYLQANKSVSMYKSVDLFDAMKIY